MEKIKFIVNIEGCLIHNNKILMILRGDTESHAPNTLAFPGGQVESKDSDSDTLEDTLKREIYEEVGLNITEHFEYLENKKFVTKKGNNVLDVVMFCRVNDITDTKIDNNEVKDCMWMSVDEILNDIRTPVWIRKSIELIKPKLNI
jgi:8-oxo-dGTP diphosphatase